METNLEKIFKEVEKELQRAEKKHEKFNSAYEGYAVIKKEMNDLWEEAIYNKKDRESNRKKAIRVAAMAIRFIKDLCPVDKTKIKTGKVDLKAKLNVNKKTRRKGFNGITK